MTTICIGGKNNIAVNALDYLLHEMHFNKEKLIVVISGKDDGIDTWQKSILKCAKDNDIAVKKLEEVYDIEDLIFFSLEFDQIIRTEKFKSKKIYNFHFSKLPAYKGMYTSVMPIINGEKTTGVTLHKIDNGIDTGDIIDQVEFKIDIQDTSRDLYFKYMDYSFKLFKKNIKNLLEDNYTSYKQSMIGSSYYSKKAIDFKNITFDFNKTSYEIYNHIRAFIFKEYQLPEINNKKIYKVRLNEQFIGYKKFIENEKEFIISGIDGYEIIAEKLL